MKAALRRVIGADRPKVIAVIATTHSEAVRGVRHALTANSPHPIHVWCAEDGPLPEGAAVFNGKATGSSVRRGLDAVWPALSIVYWNGRFGFAGLKSAPFFRPPFRVVIANEADGFFSPGPLPLAKHFSRRTKDAIVWIARRTVDTALGLPKFFWSLVYRTGERLRDVLMLIVSAFVLLLSALAQITPPAARALIKRLGGPGTLACPAVPATSANFAEVAMPVRLWPARALRKAVAASSAEFIVLRAPGETADAQPLIDLALHTGAFAVAHQQAAAGWRSRVATKHPFRRLQPGEASEVFAPHGRLIVLRRAALAHFGIPGALTAGAGLLLLYWQAAAASLSSYVLGHDGPNSDEAAMALEDAEFVLRLALSPRLRSVRPTQPDRRRGNVAFAQPLLLQPSPRPRVLVVSPYLPFPLSHGGAVRIYNLCRELATEVDFHLLCFREANEVVRYDELHKIFRAVHVLDIDEKPVDATLPKQAAGYQSTAMAGLIRRLVAQCACDLVQLEYTQMAIYLEHAAPLPTILVEHDITWTLYRQLADSGDATAHQQYDLWHTFELAALQKAQAVWVMSEADHTLAATARPKPGVWLVPNGVDLKRYQPEPPATGPLTILFVGSFRHLPNLLAFEALRGRIMPDVWKVFPDARLHAIAGPQHERAATLAKKRGVLMPDSRIRIQGFVEDVRPAYREATLVAVPVPVSAGTNIKVVEAMATGRPVVSNAVGCQGLGLSDNHDLLIREIGPEFAAGINQLLADAALRERIAEQGRRTAEERFGWDAIAREALACYRELTAEYSPG